MNKLLLYILLFTGSFVIAAPMVQDTSMAPVSAAPVADTVYYSERKLDAGFKVKYTGEDFQYETKAEGQSQWERFKAWLSRVLSEIFSFGDKTTSTSAYAIIVRMLAVLIVLFVVYLIVRALLNKEGMWIFGKSRRNITVQDAAQENIHQMDFRQLIDETKAAGDYRLAVRYYYLWLLKKLSVNEIIDWHWDKTNSDYVYEIKDQALRKEFGYLSYVYDYSWYGEFPIDDTAFAKAEKAFQRTINTL